MTPWLQRAAWPAALVYLLLLPVARDWRYGHASPTEIEGVMRSLHWMPLYYAYFAPSNQSALTSFLAVAASFAPVGALLWAIRLRPEDPLGQNQPVLTSALAAAALSWLVEAGRLATAGLRPDPTNILIAAVAAVLAQRACEWAARVVREMLRPESIVR